MRQQVLSCSRLQLKEFVLQLSPSMGINIIITTLHHAAMLHIFAAVYATMLLLGV